MKRTISAEVGKGSVNHNSRKFRAENVDGSRTHLNIDYCNERIQTVYHQLFDEALKRYNEKQTRSDRRIPNYYEKIRSGNQEKPFHEIILQIGNKEDMSATGEYAELARRVLDEYYQGFQERNPSLRVFSAHLHMDEATPHIHIDFVPFTTGSKRGLDTRVSLKQALAAQGFKGGTRGATEWAQWVQSEKEQLAAVMERYDIQWEQKGTHEKHLSVMDYKKQEREKEIAALDSDLLLGVAPIQPAVCVIPVSGATGVPLIIPLFQKIEVVRLARRVYHLHRQLGLRPRVGKGRYRQQHRRQQQENTVSQRPFHFFRSFPFPSCLFQKQDLCIF